MLIMKIVLGLFLLICTVIDLKTKSVKIALLISFAAAGAVFYCVVRPVSIYDEIAGIIVGGVFVIIWFVTGGKLGLGDALLMIVTGIYLGGRKNVVLIMGAMFMAAIYSAFILIFRKADRKKEIAFIPFMFMSFMGMVII